MSKFIRVTDAQGKTVLQEVSTVHHIEDGKIWVKDPISGLAGIEIQSTLEEIEAQLLRDEFAKAFVSGSDPSEYHEFKHLASDAYMFADAMLKERAK